MVDVFHTQFGVCGKLTCYNTPTFVSLSTSLPGLSLLGHPGLIDLDPVYCMPAHIIEKKGLRKPWEGLKRRAT